MSNSWIQHKNKVVMYLILCITRKIWYCVGVELQICKCIFQDLSRQGHELQTTSTCTLLAFDSSICLWPSIWNCTNTRKYISTTPAVWNNNKHTQNYYNTINVMWWGIDTKCCFGSHVNPLFQCIYCNKFHVSLRSYKLPVIIVKLISWL